MRDLNALFMADLHIGHQKIPTDKLLYDMETYVYPLVHDLDFFGISGDFFHTLLHIGHEGTHCAVDIISRLLHLAEQHDFIIRVVQGTYSHDRDQNELFVSLAKTRVGKPRLRYFDSLDVEYIEHLDARVLYLPDNLHYKTSDDCLADIRTKLADLQWSSVDLALGHGYFDHVLPKMAKHHQPFCFRASQFRDLVTGYVIMGHDHSYSQYENILYCSSFERTNHGEEEPKGFLTGQHRAGKWKFQFRTNDDATPFLSVYPAGDTREAQLESIHGQLAVKYPRPVPGHLRIIHADSSTRQELASALSVHYPQLQISHLTSEDPEEVTPYLTEPQFLIGTDHHVVPTEQNLAELTYQHIQLHNPASSLTREQIQARLDAI